VTNLTINGANDAPGNSYTFIQTTRGGDMSGEMNPDGFPMKITDSTGTVIGEGGRGNQPMPVLSQKGGVDGPS
jgi:hypothetical protein